MVCSWAYFPTKTEALDQAQTAKLEHILTKLMRKPGERLLDIGCGWGALVDRYATGKNTGDPTRCKDRLDVGHYENYYAIDEPTSLNKLELLPQLHKMGVWSSLRQFVYTKFIVAVDEDADVRFWPDVIWALTTRLDPVRDTMMEEKTPIDYLDFVYPVSGLGNKIGLDVTHKWPVETQRE